MTEYSGPTDEGSSYAAGTSTTSSSLPDDTYASPSEPLNGAPTGPSDQANGSTAAQPSGLTTEQIAAARPPAQAVDATPRSEETDAEGAAAPESAAASESAAAGQQDRGTQLLDERDIETMMARWDHIQVGFVDKPRQAVEDADALVADLMQQLAQMFAAERSKLEAQWSRGDQVSTEDLRIGLQRYRSFFQRLLSV